MAPIQKKPFRDQLRGLIRLTRWQEYVPFVIPLTILGSLLAARPHGILLDWRLIPVIAANILCVAYAFMINDIEDAPDAALVPERARRNPITLGMVNIRTGYTVTRIVAATTLILYAMGGLAVFLIGLFAMFLAHTYSWRPVRLKAHPVTDIVSHSLMLSGLLLLAGYFVYHDRPGVVWFVAFGATLFSVYGQLHQQLEAYQANRQAEVRNTAIWLGEITTRRIMFLSAGLSAISMLVAIFRDVFPVGFIVAVPVGFVVNAFLRGDENEGLSLEHIESVRSNNRLRSLLIINLIIVAWLIYTVGDQREILEQLQLGF